MKILPIVGIDNIRFGMTMEEVRNIWGQPDSIDYFFPLEDRPEERSVNWEYMNGTELSFDVDDDFLLGAVTTRSKSATLNGINWVGANIEKLQSCYPNLLLDDDFEENGQDYIVRELEISFWVLNGIIDSITIFPEYDQSGNNPIWPSKTINC